MNRNVLSLRYICISYEKYPLKKDAPVHQPLISNTPATDNNNGVATTHFIRHVPLINLASPEPDVISSPVLLRPPSSRPLLSVSAS